MNIWKYAEKCFSFCIVHKGQCNGKDVMLIPNEPPSAQFSPQCTRSLANFIRLHCSLPSLTLQNFAAVHSLTKLCSLILLTLSWDG